LQWVQEAILPAQAVSWLTPPHKTHTRSWRLGKGVFPACLPFCPSGARRVRSRRQRRRDSLVGWSV